MILTNFSNSGSETCVIFMSACTMAFVSRRHLQFAYNISIHHSYIIITVFFRIFKKVCIRICMFFMSIYSSLFYNFTWGNKHVYAHHWLWYFVIKDFDITKICTSRQQMSEGNLPLVTAKDAILTTYFEFLQNIPKFENIKHVTGNINMKAHWRDFIGIVTPKAVFSIKSYPTCLPSRHVCQSIIHTFVFSWGKSRKAKTTSRSQTDKL